MKNSTPRTILITTAFLILTSAVTALMAAEARNPENAAAKSDIVVHGNVSSIANSGFVARHHPVWINITEVFRGNTSSGTLKIQVEGDKSYSVSTAASFTEGEEIIVMLKERNNQYYMTNGYATKYEVQNNSIQLLEPERKNITVDEMQSIVENASVSPQNGSSSEEPVADKDKKVSWTAPIADFFEGIYNFIRNL